MPKIYTRFSGGAVRYYADLRDIGLGRYALKPPGSKQATTDPEEARRLLGPLITEKTAKRTGSLAPGSLADGAERFLKDNPGEVTEKHLNSQRHCLERAAEFFGPERILDTIKPKDVRDWIEWLRDKRRLENGTILHHLYALSPMYGYAQELELVSLGYNPVAALHRKPSAQKGRVKSKKAKFLEIDEAGRFLKAAFSVKRDPKNGLIRFPGPLIGTLLLTGGRLKEVIGLFRTDVEFDTGFIQIRPNHLRGLKRPWNERAVPIWPQLREILEEYLEEHPPQGELLFPSPRGWYERREIMITDLRTMLRDVAEEAGMSPAPNANMFRHTYATARLQTTDNGKQISLWTVAKELGHKTTSRVEDTYGHPSHYRPRGDVVEYK